MKYTSIIPATDWFFVFTSPGQESRRQTYYLAAFGVEAETGKVVGLVPVRGDNGEMSLVATPRSSDGAYLHRDQLSQEAVENATTAEIPT